jgi:predicted phosphodiesterase
MSKKVPNKDTGLVDRVLKAIKSASKELKKEPHEVTTLDLLSNDYGITNWDLRKLGGLALVKNTHFPYEEKDLRTIKDLRTEKSYINKLEKDLVDAQNLEESLADALENAPAIKVSPYKPSKKGKVKRHLSLVISDTHFGSDIKQEETGRLKYGTVEEARRFAKVIEETISYKANHRDETHLNVLLLGDLIENQLHDPADGAAITEQFARTLHLLSQGIAHLSSAFPSLTVYCTTGNHGRNTARHKTRAIAQKWDSIETMIYIALKAKLSECKNVKFVIPKAPYIVYEVFGKKIFITHGDTVLMTGNPGNNIKTGTLEDKINSINAALPDSQEYAVFIIGHHHVGSCIHLSNGAVLITNGPLVPPNDFAISLGLFEAACGQYLFESVEGYPVGDVRYIKVGLEDDNNKDLDKIIKAWEGF